MELAEVEPHVRASWDAATCDPVDLPWSPANPSRGQCGVTALVPHELVGEPWVVQRPDGPPGRCREEYELLRARVLARLDRA